MVVLDQRSGVASAYGLSTKIGDLGGSREHGSHVCKHLLFLGGITRACVLGKEQRSVDVPAGLLTYCMYPS